MAQLERFQYPRFARQYVRMSEKMDQRGVAELRGRLLDGARGRVIEVGCGNGRNFAHYPSTVVEVVAIEPDDTLRAHAEQAAREASVPVTVVAAHADELPGEDGSYDGAVVSLVLCSVPSLETALTELRRVLRPGGELRFGEHVRHETRLGGAIQDLITPLSKKTGGGCHQNRDTAAAITNAGFTMRTLDRFPLKLLPLVPGMPMITGTALRPQA